MIVKEFGVLDWITGEGHTAQTADLEGITGLLVRMDIKISSVTGNPTSDVTLSDITDTDFVTTLMTFSTLADGTLHIKLSRTSEYDADADMDEIPFVKNDLRITVDPSADPGGSAQTLTVNVKMYFLERD